MPEIFLIIASVLIFVVTLLYLAPQRRLLNFVDYGSERAVAQLNRYAAARLVLPIAVNLACAVLAFAKPAYTLPMLFAGWIAILAAVIWIAAGANGVVVQASRE